MEREFFMNVRIHKCLLNARWLLGLCEN